MKARVPAVSIVLFLLWGCGGGGGGGGSSGGSFDVPIVPVTQRPETFQTQEFRRNHGLGQIDAQHAYARGGTGDGVVVAVVDDGIDPTHPDLDDNVSPDSIDIVTGVATREALLGSSDGHGTLVAGVIAAEKNGAGMHGVAYEATILAIRSEAEDCRGREDCGFSDADIASAIDYARENGARVINLSLGGLGRADDRLQDAIENAVRAGVIIVASTGNEGAASPNHPAALAEDSLTRGLMIAVGALNRAGDGDAEFSNLCVNGARFCLIAPGEAIVTTAPGGGTATVDGTSFAAPHVSGATAVLLQLFPTLTPEQVVQLLLRTATPLESPYGVGGFGRGILNLGEAVRPQGIREIPPRDAAGPAALLEDTLLSLGAAFGDALGASDALKNAIFLDGYGRAYPVDLTRRVAPAARGFGLKGALARDESRSFELGLKAGAPFSARLSLAQDAQDDAARFAARETRRDGVSHAAVVDLSWDPRDSTTLWLGANAPSKRMFAESRGAGGYGATFLKGPEMLNPASTLMAPGEGFSIRHLAGEATTLSAGLFRGGGWDAGSGGEGWMATTALSRAFPGGGRLSASFGIVDEERAYLGSDPGGAFGEGSGTTRFATFDGALPLTDSLEAFASATLGFTEIAAGERPGLLDGFGTVHSNAFAVGLVARGVAAERDRLGFLVGQPLRVSRASANLAAPVGQEASGAITWRSGRVSLAPSGRELDVQVSYARSFGKGSGAISTWLMARMDAGHDESAATDYALGMKFEARF